MPAALTYPGVYVEEISSGVHTITGVATSVTAFVGRARKGRTNEAVVITSYGDFEREFGGLWSGSTLGFAVRDFFVNGGSRAVVVRLFHSLFANADDRAAANTAAQKVIAAGAGAATGADAKTKALAAVPAEGAASAAVVAEAGKANGFFAGLADTADAAAIAAAAALAKAAVAADQVADARTLDVGTLSFEAISAGQWGGYLRISVAAASGAGAVATAAQLGVGVADLFNLTVADLGPGGTSETYLNVTVANSANRIDRILAASSDLILWAGADLDASTPALPDFTTVKGDAVGQAYAALLAAQKANAGPMSADVVAAQKAYADARSLAVASVGDGGGLATTDFLPIGGQAAKTGLYALEQLYSRDGIFNLLVIPPYVADIDVDPALVAAAAAYCEMRRAVLLVDSPSAWTGVDDAIKGFSADPDQVGTRSSNAALFFPRLVMANPLSNNQLQPFSACGVAAGVFARTDTQRGVWKAPAGIGASLVGVASLTVPLTDAENGELNPLGINCLRNFPVYGRVLWGSRTLKGADAFADEYKYIPVRRTALFIEESLYRGTQWVVFEPNDAPLWAQIRLNVGAFMHDLFRQGAFQGTTPKDAYFVKCDADTTTQNDINAGIVNILVGFAPLKPAEFVVIQLQQIAGDIQT